MYKSRIQLIVETGISRLRLEEYLFDKFPTLSRMYIRDVIRKEKCEVNGRVENKGKRVTSGDFVEIEIEPDRNNAMRPEPMSLIVLFEDEEILVINKPAGMLVHPTHRQKTGTLLNGLSYYLNQEKRDGTVRPGLVHRLDKDTSGLIVVAKNVRAHRILARQFQRRTVRKVYVALVEGIMAKENGTIEAPIGRFADEKRWGLKVDGSPSFTRYRVIKITAGDSLLELQPETGRTNQLRIHCESIGHPIVGDVTRGGRSAENLCLHAYRLRFHHPANGGLVDLRAALPNWAQA